MADTTPNTDNPSTTADYNAVAALNKAKTEAANTQAQLLAAQKVLATAQAGDDPAVAQLAAATQTSNLAAQKKALSDSQAAILKNEFSVPASGYTGEVKLGDKAGVIEGTLLAARATEAAAERIATEIAKKGNAPIVLYGGTDLPDFQALEAFQAQYAGLENSLEKAATDLAKAQEAVQALQGPQPEFAPVAGVAAVGAGLDAANKILGFFRTDYSIQGVSVSNDDLLLVTALAGSLDQRGTAVEIPALYNAAALHQMSGVVSKLETLAASRGQVQQIVDAAAKRADQLTAGAAKELDPERKKKLVSAAAELKSAGDQAKAALALYDGFLTKLTSADDKGKFPLSSLIQQDAIRAKLADKANLLSVKMSAAGGSTYTKKNMWSFFGGMPFYIRGGVVVSYVLMDGRSGAVLSAGAVPLDGEFFRVNNLPADMRALQTEKQAATKP